MSDMRWVREGGDWWAKGSYFTEAMNEEIVQWLCEWGILEDAPGNFADEAETVLPTEIGGSNEWAFLSGF
jgi:hypothetical protein